VIRHALKLAAKGLKLFPCQPRGKAPCCQHGVLDATDDAERIQKWWTVIPAANIGVATGRASGFFVLDIDSLDAEAELRRLEEQHGALPPSIESITPRGRHIFFRMPDVMLKNSAGKVAPGIDIRADGGYIIAPPSITTRRYCWSVDCAAEIAEVPAWLLAKITAPNNSNGHKSSAPPTDWHALIVGGVGEGARNDTLTKLCGYLLRRYVDPFITLELVRVWNATRCVPPLPPQDIERIVGSIAGRELRRRHQGD
jgi:hypothetical protein